jgi:hypothetical protein
MTTTQYSNEVDYTSEDILKFLIYAACPVILQLQMHVDRAWKQKQMRLKDIIFLYDIFYSTIFFKYYTINKDNHL